MDLEKELMALKSKIEELRDRRASLTTEVNIKDKQLTELKEALKKRLDAQGVKYGDLNQVIAQLESDLTARITEIKEKIGRLTSE